MMNKFLALMILVSFNLLISYNSSAQEGELMGTVYYQQIDKFEFEPTGRIELDQYAKTMPTEFQFEKMLHFNESKSLFEDSPNPSAEPLSRRDRWILHRSKWGKKPKANLNKIYCDFEKEEKTELKEFMTRQFRVQSPLAATAWKLLNETPKMIMGYNCMAAEYQDGENVIKAWFTPQIPVSAGPAEYNGLPGLILAVEKNDYTIYVASRFNKELESDVLKRPKEGKKVTEEELDQIIVEKTEEFKKERMGNGKNPHGRRH